MLADFKMGLDEFDEKHSSNFAFFEAVKECAKTAGVVEDILNVRL